MAESNDWESTAKVWHFATSLRIDTNDVLLMLSEEQRYNFDALSNVLKLCFGQELTTNIERLSQIAYSNYPADVENKVTILSFVDGVWNLALQTTLRLADIKNLKFTLVEALKFDADQKVSHRERHNVRVISAQDYDFRMVKLQKNLEHHAKESCNLKEDRNRKKSMLEARVEIHERTTRTMAWWKYEFECIKN